MSKTTPQEVEQLIIISGAKSLEDSFVNLLGIRDDDLPEATHTFAARLHQDEGYPDHPDIDFGMEIAAAVRQEITSETTQMVYRTAREGVAFAEFDCGNYVPSATAMRDILKTVDPASLVIASPTFYSMVRAAGVLEQDGPGEAQGVQDKYACDAHPIIIDMYSAYDAPVLIVQPGWLTYAGTKVEVVHGDDGSITFTTDYRAKVDLTKLLKIDMGNLESLAFL